MPSLTLRFAHPKPMRGKPLIAVWGALVTVGWGLVYLVLKGACVLFHLVDGWVVRGMS